MDEPTRSIERKDEILRMLKQVWRVCTWILNVCVFAFSIFFLVNEQWLTGIFFLLFSIIEFSEMIQYFKNKQNSKR